MSTSNIINKIVDKGASAAAAGLQNGGWVNTLVDSAKNQTSCLGAYQPAVNDALSAISDNKSLVGRISAQAFVAIVSHLALNQDDQAKLVFLATSATFSQRMAVLDADDAAAAKAKEDSDKVWASIKTLALDLLEAAGKAAIPILLLAL